MPAVNIPNVGVVNFPDSMSQADIISAIENDILPKYGNKQAEQPQTEPQAQAPAQQAPANEKPSILAGTKLGPEKRITPFNSSVGPEEMPTSLYTGDISKMPEEWGVGKTLLQSAKVGIPQLLQGASTTGFIANANIINKIDTVEQQLAAGKKNFTIEEDPLGIADMTAEQRTKFRADTESALGNRAAGIAQRQAEVEAIPQNPIVQKVMKAGKEEGLSGFIDEFKKDPVNFVAAIGPSSLVSNAPGMIAAIPATIAGGPAAGAAVMGAGSFATDYPSTIISALAENGVDIKDPEALKAAAKDKELMDKVGKQAFAHASAVGAIDAISAGVASKVPLPKSVMRALENKPVARELTNIALQAPIQGTLGASGEALGQLAAGQQLDWGNIGAEFAGEFFGAPVEVAAVSAGRVKEVTGERLNERAEIKEKVAEDVAYKTAMSNILASKGFVFNSPQEQQAIVNTLTAETEVGGDKESRFTTLFNRLKDFNNAKEEELGALIDSIKGKFATKEPATTPATSPEPQPAPGPQVTTSAGTPIAAAPLDTAEKQVAAKAAAPITPTTTPDIEAQAKEKSVELGIPLEDARKLVGAPPVAGAATTVNAINTGNPELDTIANGLKAKYNLSNDRAIKQATEILRQQKIVSEFGDKNGTQPSTSAIPGANQPSVPVSQNGLQPAGGVTTSQLAGLASPVGVTGQPGVRAEAVQTAESSALTPVTPGLESLDSPESQKVQNDTGTMAHTLFNPNNVRADGRPGWDTPPAERWPLINAFEMGGRDARSGYSKGASDYKNKQEKQAYELGLKYANGLMTGSPIDVSSEAASLLTTAAPAPTATKGKRTGRPRVELTAEEAEAKKQAKAAQTKDWKAATKTVQAAIETLDTPEPIRDNFATQDAYLDAGVQHRARRNQALDTLHELSKGQQRDSKPGKAAKEALSHPSVTTQEQANLQQRIEIKKKAAATAGKPSKSETSGTPDSKYYSFDNASQAINYIANNGTLFERFLAKRLRPFLKGVNLIVVNAANEVPESLRTNFKGANGLYAATELNGKSYKTIYLRGESFGNSTGFQGVNNTVFLHEALHAAVNARIDEWRSLLEEGKEIPQKLGDAINGLMDVMRNASREYAYQTLTGTTNIDPRVAQLFTSEAEGGIQIYDDLKEFVAYGLTEDSMQQFLFQTKGEIVPNQPGRFRSLFNRFVRSIRDLFDMDDSHQSALQDLIVLTEGLLKYDTELQEAPQVSAARQKKVKAQKLDQDTKKVMRSQNIHDIAEGFGGWVRDGHDFGDLVDLLKARFKGMTEDTIKTTLMTLRTSDIIRWMGDKIAGLKEIDEFTQKMAAMRTNMLEAYAAKADQLAKFIVSNKGSDKILGNAMHLARLKGVTPDAHATAIETVNADPKVIELTKLIEDPATPAEKISNLTGQRTRRKNDIQIVYDAWTQLGKIEGGHEMYKMVRQFYKDNFNLQRHYLDERIERLQELPGDAKDEKTPKGQLMAEIRKMQEKDAIQEYFPLMRHGPAWFRESGTDGGFILFDEPWQRELYAIKRAKELGKPVEELFKDLTFTSGNDIASLRNTNQRESTMLKNMFEIIDKANLNEISSEDLKDSLYQTWLTTLPEASIRKQFMHAENVSGFSADIFRNFTESANRMASQTPRLKYADQMQTEITRARDSLAGDPDQAKLGLFIDTVGGRAMEQLNPPSPNQLASIATRYAYYMLLTGAGSAAVQLVAVPVMIYPVLGARYGYARASLKFAAYSNILGSMGVNIKETPETIRGYHIPSVTVSVADSSRIKNSKTLSAAYQALKERGLFAFTENNLLSQRGRTPLNATLSGPKKALRMTANIMSGLFSGAERVSREIAAMMAFEMHYDKTKNFEESVEKAIAAVQDNMGRYDAMERPELFKKLPVISQFKMYAANMTSFFVRHAYNSTKVISDPKLAFESMKILTGVLMMGAMFHGLKGMPLYSVVGAMVEALSDLGDDDEEKRRKRARNPLVAQNADLRFREFLNDNFGPVMGDILYSGPISSLTDINIGAKTSFDNLWFRGGKPAKTNQEAFNNFVLANIGPAVSGILGQTGALDDFENGHIERGLEKMLPAFFKNPLVAGRLATEGAKTKGGDTIIKKEDVTAANVIAQAAGFAPTKLARQQEVGFELKGEYVKAEQERTQILQRLTDSVLNKDFGGGQKDVQPVINQIRQFNKRYPMDKVMIDGDAIQNTLDSALEARVRTYKGVRIPTEAMIPYFVPVLNQGKK
jgi:hypothetical protein